MVIFLLKANPMSSQIILSNRQITKRNITGKKAEETHKGPNYHKFLNQMKQEKILFH